jgi:hypothetical protein
MTAALRGEEERVRRFWIGGLLTMGTLVFAIGLGAYMGWLPTGIAAVPHLDWVAHALLIGSVAFFLDGALGHRPLVRGTSFPRVGPLSVAVVAGVEEYLQRFSPRRSSSFGDFAADLVGICFFAWLSKRVGDAHREGAPGAGSPEASRS